MMFAQSFEFFCFVFIGGFVPVAERALWAEQLSTQGYIFLILLSVLTRFALTQEIIPCSVMIKSIR